MSNTAYILVEGGPIFGVCKEWVSAFIAARQAGMDYAKGIGGEATTHMRQTGQLSGVVFPRGETPEGWTKPNGRRISYPKKRSQYHKEVAALPAAHSFLGALQAEIGPVSHDMSWEDGECSGSQMVGPFFGVQCYTFNGADGPFLLEVPDLARARKNLLAERPSATIKESRGADWNFSLEGTRRVLKEEWDFLAAKHALEDTPND